MGSAACPEQSKTKTISSCFMRLKPQPSEQHVENQQEKNRQENETIPRDPFLVTQRPQSTNAPCRQVTHQLWIVRRRAVEESLHLPPRRPQIILSHPKVIEMSCRF